MLDRQIILDRKQGRDHAKPVIELARSEAAGLPPEGVIAFWTELREEAIRQLPPPPEKPSAMVPMSDHVAAAFANGTKLAFGKHCGQSIAAVADTDPQYLFWLADRKDEFQQTIRRYVANPGVAAYLNRNEQD